MKQRRVQKKCTLLPQSPVTEFVQAFYEIVRYAEVESLSLNHFECKIPLALTLDLLRPSKLELIVITNIISYHLF